MGDRFHRLSRLGLIPYPRSQKRVLVEGLEELCKLLKRPVCSADLSEFYTEFPAWRPVLKKRLGQVLLAAARQRGKGRRIFPVGVFQGHGYYAPEDSPKWRQAFEMHRASIQLERLESLHVPGALLLLERQCPEKTDRHAIEAILRLFEAEREMLQKRSVGETSHFVNSPPEPEIIPRKEAVDLLLGESRGRRSDASPLSPFRHLVVLRWPQSVLWPGSATPQYLPAQVRAYVRWRWPVHGEKHHKARFVGLRYGIDPAPEL